MASVAELTVQLAQLREKLRIAKQGLANLNPSLQMNQAILARYRTEVNDLPIQISAVEAQLAGLRGSNSAGEIVRDDQAAKANRSNSLSPLPSSPVEYLKNDRIQNPPDTDTSSNALTPNIKNSQDSGTDGRIRPLTETQSTAPGASQLSPGVSYGVPGYSTVNEDAFVGGNFTGVPFAGQPTPGGQPGVGAGSDDTGKRNQSGTTGQSGNATVSELALVDYGKITPQANVLDQYASYTYQISLYLFNKADYEAGIDSKQRSLAGAQLLIQSGGAAPIGRSDYFSLDYYIDRLELKSFITGKGVGLAHNVEDIKMTVIEPNGISFIQNLDKAAAQFTGGTQAKKEKFTQQIYLLVIRFYGYDDQGNLVRGGINKPDQTSDPNAFIEKWYPVVISDIKFKIASKAVEYEISATGVPYFVNASAKHATIPFNIELSGQTLKDILAGPAVYAEGQAALNPVNAAAARAAFAATDPRRVDLPNQTVNTALRTGVNLSNANAGGGRGGPTTYQAPPKADAANTGKKTIRQGLMAALNEYQQDLVKQKVIDIPDEYEIEFVLDSLASAKVTSPSGLDKSATSMSQPGTAGEQKLGSKQSMDPNSRVEGAVAGMQVVQFIDTMIRNSTYIKDQQVLAINDDTKKIQPTGVKTKNTSWYKIGFQATPKTSQGIDKKRNSYAWKIKYIISPYKLSQLNSPFFNVPLPTGTHKQYRYWFTGQNDSVLSYEENLNNLYYVVLSGADLTNRSANNADYLQYQYQTASGQASVGATGKTNEPGANAADQLYSPADLQECNLSIVGDPAWLQQGEASLGLSKNDPDYFKPFLADGTINFDSQQILFEVGFNTPQDYNIDSGLIEPKWSNLDINVQKYYSTRQPGLAQITRTYFAKEVISHFNKGKFTQDIKGSIMPYVNNLEVPKPAPTTEPTTTAEVAAPVNTPAKKFEPPRSSVTNPQPTSSLAKGVQQILQPVTNGTDLTDAQLRATPIYNQTRRSGGSDAAALSAARAASATGTNNYSGSALPGIRVPNQLIVKDQ